MDNVIDRTTPPLIISLPKQGGQGRVFSLPKQEWQGGGLPP